jgi:hypothetical protein
MMKNTQNPGFFSPVLLLRLASFCFIFFAFGHSIGHFTRYDIANPTIQNIQKMMINNKYDMFGVMRSLDEHYTGMSLNLIFTLISLSILVFLFSMQVKKGNFTKNYLIPVLICSITFAINSYLFFFFVPAITCAVASILLIAAFFKLEN